MSRFVGVNSGYDPCGGCEYLAIRCCRLSDLECRSGCLGIGRCGKARLHYHGIVFGVARVDHVCEFVAAQSAVGNDIERESEAHGLSFQVGCDLCRALEVDDVGLDKLKVAHGRSHLFAVDGGICTHGEERFGAVDGHFIGFGGCSGGERCGIDRSVAQHVVVFHTGVCAAVKASDCGLGTAKQSVFSGGGVQCRS